MTAMSVCELFLFSMAIGAIGVCLLDYDIKKACFDCLCNKSYVGALYSTACLAVLHFTELWWNDEAISRLLVDSAGFAEQLPIWFLFGMTFFSAVTVLLLYIIMLLHTTWFVIKRFYYLFPVSYIFQLHAKALIWAATRVNSAVVALLSLLFLLIISRRALVQFGFALIQLILLLVAIAYYTLAERKIMAAIQRRRGPNIVGYWGLLQPLADGLKLVAKELLFPVHANLALFVVAPLFILTLSLSAWSILPGFCEAVSVLFVAGFSPDLPYGVLALLAISSMSVYSLILAGWASNSKYAFLGALRSAAQMISYEVSISLVLLPVILLANSFSLVTIAVRQERLGCFVFSMLPAALIFGISIVAETNRTPFDLPEAEAELVAGYNVDYSSIIFAMFFLAEYANMMLMAVLAIVFFAGGWTGVSVFAGLFSFVLKILIFCFMFILIRATLPRYRYDQLMDIGWKIFLPIATVFILFVVGILTCLNGVPENWFF